MIQKHGITLEPAPNGRPKGTVDYNSSDNRRRRSEKSRKTLAAATSFYKLHP
jgi:hypothetical protein